MKTILIIKRFVINLLNTSRRNDIFGKYIVYGTCRSYSQFT